MLPALELAPDEMELSTPSKMSAIPTMGISMNQMRILRMYIPMELAVTDWGNEGNVG